MVYAIDSEISRFNENSAKLQAAGFKVEKYCEYGFLVQPKSAHTIPVHNKDKTIGLTLLGITHGTEWAGSAVMNEVITFLLRESFVLQIPVAFALGNPWAARENKRFLESDLNRSFAVAKPQTKEQKRARELQAILKETAFLVDFHQTMEKSEQPFFIFPYGKGSFELACTISQRTPVVTHWGKPFSKDGQCSDEFTNSCGGIGITVELGQNGFDPYQIAAGTMKGLRAIEVATAVLTRKQKLSSTTEAEIFTWAQVIDYPEGEVSLEPGLFNFAPIASGQKLGSINGRELLSEHNGRILFPAYPRKDRLRKPAELCRIMRRVSPEELGKAPKF